MAIQQRATLSRANANTENTFGTLAGNPYGQLGNGHLSPWLTIASWHGGRKSCYFPGQSMVQGETYLEAISIGSSFPIVSCGSSFPISENVNDW